MENGVMPIPLGKGKHKPNQTPPHILELPDDIDDVDKAGLCGSHLLLPPASLLGRWQCFWGPNPSLVHVSFYLQKMLDLTKTFGTWFVNSPFFFHCMVCLIAP